MKTLLVMGLLSVWVFQEGRHYAFGQPVCGVGVTNVTVFHGSDIVNGAYKTWTVDVNVTIHNSGTAPINCTVSAFYYNATFTQQIGTSQNVDNLTPSNTTTLTFEWDIYSIPVGVTYTVKANVSCTCGASDEYVDGLMRKRLWGDINDSGHVSLADVGKLALVYSFPPPPDPMCDINGDAVISLVDVGKLDLIYSGYPPPFP